MALSSAERQKRYRERNAQRAESVTRVTENVTERNGSVTESCVTNPLDVYCQRRWDYLQSCGYVWDESRGRAILVVGEEVTVGVTVPGDPGHDGIYLDRVVP